MITVQILTKNNEKTIKNCLESIQSLNPKIIVGDFGSTDDTLNILKEFNAEVVPVRGMPRNEARERLASLSLDAWNLWIEPWEIVFQNPKSFMKLKEKLGYVRIINNQMVTWEIRLWKGNCKFIYPIFETIKETKASDSSMILSSKGMVDLDEAMPILNEWKSKDPLLAEPYYYQACLFLSQNKYEDFLKTAEHYLFIEKKFTMSSVMIRYYYALIQLTQKRLVKPVLQNINLCLCAKPLMAEFWCLTGDVYYHLLKKFDLAKEFYENAIILGQKRLYNDKWPMDITKYNKYPNKMIDSCNKILDTKFNYVTIQ